MKLTWTQDYAVLIICKLAKEKKSGYVSLSEISQSHGVSLPMLKKIARNLKSAGLIKSKEGSGGGYVLNKDPAQISVWDVLFSLYSDAKEDKILPYDVCPLKAHCIHQVLRKRIHDTLEKTLKDLTIKKIIS